MSRSMKTSPRSPESASAQMGLFPAGSLPDGHVRTSALRAQDLAWTVHALDYGAKSRDWLARLAPTDSSWRTAQTSLQSMGALTSELYSGTWPRSGCMSNGIAYQLPPLTHPTSVIASGSWRTGEELMPTLISRDWKDSAGMSLEGVNPDGSQRQRDDTLPRRIYAQERRMPTLTKADGTGGPGRSEKRKGEDNLRTAVLLPTLTATRRSGLQSHGENAILGSLNPTWCEWFMGVPTGWSELPASETSTRRSSRKR